MKEISFEIYKARERAIEKLEDELELVEEEMCIRDRLKGAVTKETAVKPEYVGEGCLVLEPTYKYLSLIHIYSFSPLLPGL